MSLVGPGFRAAAAAFILITTLQAAELWQLVEVKPADFPDQKSWYAATIKATQKNTVEHTRLSFEDLTIEIPVGWEALPALKGNEVLKKQNSFMGLADAAISFGIDVLRSRNIMCYLIREIPGSIDGKKFDETVKLGNKAKSKYKIQFWNGQPWSVREEVIKGEGGLLSAITHINSTGYKFVALWNEDAPSNALATAKRIAETIKITSLVSERIKPVTAPKSLSISERQKTGKAQLVSFAVMLKAHSLTEGNFNVARDMVEGQLSVYGKPEYTFLLPPSCFSRSEDAMFGADASAEIKRALRKLKLPPRCPYRTKQFVIYALADLDDDSTLDTLIVDEKNNLVHLVDDQKK